MSEQDKRVPYTSDLSNKQWEIIEPHIHTPQLIEVKNAFTHIEKY
jgi:hypothetical protein